MLEPHNAEKQRLYTLLITNPMLPLARERVDGFAALEEELITWLHRTYGTVVELFYAHGLRQGPHTLQSTGFDVHQDTEDYDFIEYTVVVKITADEPGEAPSEMRVVGGTRHFEYGPNAGDAGSFRARVYHASVVPKSTREHMKIAFFFRKSEKGERRVNRRTLALGAEPDHGSVGEEEIERRRQKVAREIEASSRMAGRSESLRAYGVESNLVAKELRVPHTRARI